MRESNGNHQTWIEGVCSDAVTEYALGVVSDTRAVVRSDERVLLVFLILLSIVALSVFLHYTVSILDGLPAVPATLVAGDYCSSR